MGRSRFAADAVCYGNSIGIRLLDRVTTAWDDIVVKKQQVKVATLCLSDEGSAHKKMPGAEHA